MTIVLERQALEEAQGARHAEKLLPEITAALATEPRQCDFTARFGGYSHHHLNGFVRRLGAAIPAYRFSANVVELEGFTALRN